IKEIKAELLTDGLDVEDKLHIPKVEADEVEQRLFVNVPETFRIIKVSLNGEEVEYNSDGIDVSGYEDNTKITVKIALRKNAQESFDLFAPVEWDWKITQTGTSEEDDSDDKPSPPEPPEEEDTNDNEDEEESNQNEEKSEEEKNNTESPDESEIDEANTEVEVSTDENAEDSTEQDTQEDANEEEVEDVPEADDEEEETDDPPESEDPETITITKTELNNYIYKEVQTPVKPAITKTMMDATAATVDDYY